MPLLLRTLRAWRLDYVVLFTIFFAALVFIQLSPVIGDPDGFYHAAMAQFLSRGVVLKALPWMQATTLRDQFTDHHLLYHVALVPFVLLGKPLVGVKLATAFFSAGFFTAFYALLRRLKGYFPLLMTVALFFCSGFLFRLSLVKANSLSLILVCFLLATLFERRWTLLGMVSAVYVWLYGGWIVGWVIAGTHGIVEITYRIFLRQSSSESRVLKNVRIIKASVALPLLATAGGSIVALIVNPYWPQNISFYWQQIWEIAIVNKGAVINVGGEWSGFTLREWITDASFVGIFGLAALYLVFSHARKVHLKTWTTLALSMVFSAFMFKSRRYLELALPFMAIFSSLAFADILPKKAVQNLWHSWQLRPRLKRDVLGVLVLAAICFCFIPRVGLWENVLRVRDEIANGIPLTKYRKVSAWLARNTLPASIVVHSDWDDWPMLFYYNQRNYYLVGLDPTFMYDEDPILYQDWAKLTGSGKADSAVDLVTRRLRARYVLIEKDHTAFQELIDGTLRFKPVYEDDDAWVYRFSAEER